MSSPVKKNIKRSLQWAPESSPNTAALPSDLIVSILTRVSRLYYTKLSLVSKRFRSLLASPELYQSRNLLGCTETFLYVCLSFPNEGNPRWLTLYRKPNRTTMKNLLAPIPILNNPPHIGLSNLVAVGSNIYAISRILIESCSSTTCWFLDCRTNTWIEAPRMLLAHTNSWLNGEMYLAGKSETPDSLHCVKVYNTMTQDWIPVPPRKRIWKPENMEGKIYVHANGESVALKANDFTWEPVGWEEDMCRYSICMIDGITYQYDPIIMFVWRKMNSDGKGWGKLRGLEELPKFEKNSTVRLANYGGKLVVLWDKYVPASGYKEKMIWCAEISLEIRNSDDIWGKVEWSDAVLSVPNSYKFVAALAATV